MQDHVVHFNIAIQEVILVMSNENIHGCRVCVPLIPVLCVIANINITTHGQAVSIATPSDSKSLHCLAELHLRQTKHFGIQQLVEESYTQTLNLVWSTEQLSCTCPDSSDEKSSFSYNSGNSQLHVFFIQPVLQGLLSRHLFCSTQFLQRKLGSQVKAGRIAGSVGLG